MINSHQHKHGMKIMTEYFKNVAPVKFEGSETTNPLAFRHYDADEKDFRQIDERAFTICGLLLA